MLMTLPGMTFIGAEVTFEFLNGLQGNLLKCNDNKTETKEGEDFKGSILVSQCPRIDLNKKS